MKISISTFEKIKSLVSKYTAPDYAETKVHDYDSKKHDALIEKGHESWFNALSPSQQESYIKLHPTSKYAKSEHHANKIKAAKDRAAAKDARTKGLNHLKSGGSFKNLERDYKSAYTEDQQTTDIGKAKIRDRLVSTSSIRLISK
jgi:hypothetical protein